MPTSDVRRPSVRRPVRRPAFKLEKNTTRILLIRVKKATRFITLLLLRSRRVRAPRRGGLVTTTITTSLPLLLLLLLLLLLV